MERLHYTVYRVHAVNVWTKSHALFGKHVKHQHRLGLGSAGLPPFTPTPFEASEATYITSAQVLCILHKNKHYIFCSYH